jgi:diguanylate cyclase (GGDEF)-like protein
MSIRYKIFLILLLVTFSTLVVNSGLYYFYSQNSIKKEALEHLSSISNLQQRLLKHLFDENIEKLSLINSRTQLRISLDQFNQTKEPRSLEMVHKIIADALKNTKSIDDILVMDKNGMMVSAVHSKEVGKSLVDNPLFFAAKKSIFVSFLPSSGNTTPSELYFSAPLQIEGKFVGVIAMKANMEGINQIIEEHTGLGNSGEVVLGIRNDNGEMMLISPLRFASSPMVLRSDSPFAAAMEAALSHKERVFEKTLDYRGEPVIAISRYLEELGVGIVVKIDRSEVFGINYDLQILVLELIIGLLVVVAIISIFLANRITKPILDIKDVALLISRGDLDKRVHEMTEDELGQLADALNKMADQLIQINQILEQKVSERTAELVEMNQKLQTITLTDPLTGLSNRRKLTSHLEEEWRRGIRGNCPISVLMIDIDYFKAINDCFGHPVGDAYLRKLAEVFRESVRRPGDLAARFGGEEFIILLENTNEASALAIAESIRQKVETLQLENPQSSVSPYLSVSIGIATLFPQDGDETLLIECADEALYEAKRIGRNRCIVWSENLAGDEREMEKSL